MDNPLRLAKAHEYKRLSLSLSWSCQVARVESSWHQSWLIGCNGPEPAYNNSLNVFYISHGSRYAPHYILHVRLITWITNLRMFGGPILWDPFKYLTVFSTIWCTLNCEIPTPLYLEFENGTPFAQSLQYTTKGNIPRYYTERLYVSRKS